MLRPALSTVPSQSVSTLLASFVPFALISPHRLAAAFSRMPDVDFLAITRADDGEQDDGVKDLGAEVSGHGSVLSGRSFVGTAPGIGPQLGV